jgi:predicted DNA-binding transcriptional regulator YafY
MKIPALITIIDLIQARKTGTPKELAKKLKISERMVYKYMDELKQEFNAPVKYDKTLKTYYFSENGTLNLRWKPKKIQTEIELQ